jgi:cytoskeleton protein RodZ
MTGDIPPETPLSGADQAAPNTPSDVITPPENPASDGLTTPENTPVEETGATPAIINTPDTQTVSGKALTATVSERTWVKIIADDTAPKEYIFQPGATHTWRAERGFDVTVGNAGGIEFSFNGETIKNLGEIGEVKKLRFPDDFQTKWEE